MESFFDFIFGNMFFVVIIIAAIFNFFNKAKQEEEEQETPQRRTQTGGQPSQPEREQARPRSLRERMEKALTDIEKEWKQPEAASKEQEKPLPSIEAQRQAQYERLRSQYQPITETENETSSSEQTESIKQQGKLKPDDEVLVATHHKMTKQSLVDGVIMAEILGPPRGLKPYKNVVQQRQQ